MLVGGRGAGERGRSAGKAESVDTQSMDSGDGERITSVCENSEVQLTVTSRALLACDDQYPSCVEGVMQSLISADLFGVKQHK